MQAFLFRVATLAIRFLCPLAVLALSSAEKMGEYYLFMSYFTFVVGVSALELAVPFSRKFLRCKSDRHRRLVFSGFLANQIYVTTILAFPAGIMVSAWTNMPISVIPFFCLTLLTETCVNEVGRFFWNIGEWRMPSLRDLFRSIVFTFAILISISTENKILTHTTFIIIASGNLCILLLEFKTWGNSCMISSFLNARKVRNALLRVRGSLNSSLPQFAHMQVLGLQPLLERILIEKSFGLVSVGAYSFLISVLQSAAGLILVPMVANLKKHLLGARTLADNLKAHKEAFILLLQIIFALGMLAILTYIGLPLLNVITGKEINVSFSLLFVAYITSVSAIFCSAVAPLLSKKGHAWFTNVLSLAVLAPLMGIYLFFPLNNIGNIAITVIGLVALLQLIVRVLFIINVDKK
jgi:hypothetical protein